MPYKDPEKRKEYHRKKSKKHCAKCVAEDPDYRKDKANKYRDKRIELKDQVYVKLGNKCSNPACQWLNPDGSRGCKDRRCLQIDHVFGGGTKENKRNRGNSYLRKVLEDIEGRYQLLCANCNWIKRTVNGEYNARIYKD